MIITHDINMNLDRSGTPPRIDAVQGDAHTRQLRISLFSGGVAWEVPTDVQLLARYRKPDGTGGAYDSLPDDTTACTVSGNVITVVLAPQVLAAAGLARLDVCLIRDTAVISTFQVHIDVHANASADGSGSEDYFVSTGFVPSPAGAVEGEFLRVVRVGEGGLVRETCTAGVDDGMVDVLLNETMDLTAAEGNVTRRAYPVGNPISLGDAECVRLNSLGVKAAPGSAVRFALYEVQRGDDNTGILTRLDDIGDAVADSETGLAVLELGGSYEITRDSTVILALAQEAVIRCYELGQGLVTRDVIWFDDSDYWNGAVGTIIPCGYTTGQSGEPAITWSVYQRDLDHLFRCTLREYIRGSAAVLRDAAEKMKNPLPGVSALDGGKILEAADGGYRLVAVKDSSVAAYIDAYMEEALGGDY